MNNSSFNRRTSSKDYQNTNPYPITNYNTRNNPPKTKSIPISINSNPSPGMFVFKNQLSNIVTSYKDISTKLENKDKIRYANKYNLNKGNEGSKVSSTSNQLPFNTFMSNNSKMSICSNQSMNVMPLPIPAKNMTTSAFHKKIMSNTNGTTTNIAPGCRNNNTINLKKHSISVTKMKPHNMVIQVKTENTMNIDSKQKNSIKEKAWVSLDKIAIVKKNNSVNSGVIIVKGEGNKEVRKKSLDMMMVADKKTKNTLEFERNKCTAHAQRNINMNPNPNQRYSKITLSNIEERILHINQFNKKIDKLKAKIQNDTITLEKQKMKNSNRNNINKKGTWKRNSYSNKIILIQTKGTLKSTNNNNNNKEIVEKGKSRDDHKQNHNISSNSNANNNKINSLSNDYTTKPQSTKPKMTIKLKDIKETNTIESNSKPLDLLTSQIPPIPIMPISIPIIQQKPISFNKPIKKSLNPTYDLEFLQEPQIEYKKSSITEPNLLNNNNNDLIRLEIIEDDQTERLFNDNFYQDNDLLRNINPFTIDDFIPPISIDEDNEAEEEKEDKFDDLNSIVRIIKFKSIRLDDINVWTSNEENKLYQHYAMKFNNDYDNLFDHNKNKASERKKMNVSLSTQESSYKKCISPFYS